MRKPAKGKKGVDFYRAALSEAERLRLPKAREMEGIDEEIAVLRVKLFTAVEADSDKLDLLVKGMGMLVRAVATRYRLSPRAEQDLAENLAGVVNGVGAALGMGEFSDVAEG